MDYTLSADYWTDPTTGQRMHREDQAVPTVWSDKDANAIMWSLMELVKAGGLAGIQFDPATKATYDVVLRAVQTLIANAVKVVSDQLPGISERTLLTGDLILTTGGSVRPGTINGDGGLLLRADFPELYAFAAADGLVSEAEWSGGAYGRYSVGNGSTTFRKPDYRGMFLRGLDGGRGIDAGRTRGVVQGSQNLSHLHTGTTEGAGGHTVTIDIPQVLHTNSGTTSGVTDGPPNSGQQYTYVVGNHSHPFTTSSSGGNEARPTNLPILFLIKY